MKFCHLLETTSRDNPTYRSLFLFYKYMKKQTKRLPPAGSGSADFTRAEGRFVETLVQQISALNAVRMERQSSCTVVLAALRERLLSSQADVEERQQVYQALVNFHGQALLLMHHSILSYTAVVKILKKHHKHTGMLLQAPHLREMLTQPAWSTEVVTGMIGEAEGVIRRFQVELFGGSGECEVAGPHRAQGSSPLVDRRVLINTLASLANSEGEDSGEDSMLGTASEDEDDDAASVCSFAPQSSSHPAASSGIGGSVGSPGLAAGGAAREGATSSGVEPFENRALMEQMQSALQTWEYLQTHASTPSTVVRQ